MGKLRTSCCIKVLLIFGGIILMQFFAAFIYIFASIFIMVFSGASYTDVLNSVSETGLASTDSVMWISAISASLSMLWCLVLYLRSSWRVKGMDYRKVFSPANIAAIAATGLGGCIVLTVFLSMLINLFPSSFNNYNELMSNFDSSGGILTFAYVLVIGPASEELIFRGAIFDRMHLAFPFWTANALQALLFGIYHMNLVQGIYAFLLGMVLGMVIYSTGSILCSIAVHMVFNSTSYIIQFIFNGKSAVMGVLFLFCIIMSIIILAFSLHYYIIKCNEKYKWEKNKGRG